MSSKTKYFFIILLFLLSSIASWKIYFRDYNQKDAISIHRFPREIGQWKSTDLIIAEDEYALLETRNAFVRRYYSPQGQEVYLFIVYSQMNRKVSHPPEICYTGNGVSVVSNVHETIWADVAQSTQIRTNKLILEKGDIQQVAYYWFKVGNLFESNYWVQQLKVAINSLMGNPPSSGLIRVSATIVNGDRLKAEENAKEFIKVITPILLNYLP